MPILQESNGKFTMGFPKAMVEALGLQKGDLFQMRVKSKTEICLKIFKKKQEEMK